MRVIVITVVMAVGLFIYGYTLSSMGHEHGDHDEVVIEKEYGGSSAEEAEHAH